MKKILIPSSAGGHLDEVLQLKPLIEKYDCLFVTENIEHNKSILEGYNYILVRPAGDKYGFKFWRNLIINFYLAFKIIKSFKPDAIVTTGVHTSIPFCIIGKLYKSKIIYILSFCKSNSRALSANIVYPFADLFFVQWEEAKKLYKKSIYAGQIY